MVVEESFHCLVVHHVLSDYSGPVLCATELEALLGHAFQLFLQLDEVGCSSQYIGGDRPNFPVATASVYLDSVIGASVFMLLDRRGTKRFFVTTKVKIKVKVLVSSPIWDF
jgi:hypothetical protein